MYLNHINLATGRRRRVSREYTSEAALVCIAKWLMPIINTGKRHPLPEPFEAYSAIAYVQQGYLVVTVYGKKPQVGAGMPLVTFGVAHRSRQAKGLWEALTNPKLGPIAESVQQPATPWLAVHIHPATNADLDALVWLGDFEQVVAWAWITRQRPELKSA